MAEDTPLPCVDVALLGELAQEVDRLPVELDLGVFVPVEEANQVVDGLDERPGHVADGGNKNPKTPCVRI